jgi:hypothetical protein
MKKKGQYAKVTVKIGAGPAVPVLELREWTISGSSEKIGANVAGDDWADHLIGLFSWEGEATCISGDQYWLDMLAQKVEISFYDVAGDLEPTYVGTASVDFERGVPHDDIIESTLTFTGAGALSSPAAATI